MKCASHSLRTRDEISRALAEERKSWGTAEPATINEERSICSATHARTDHGRVRTDRPCSSRPSWHGSWNYGYQIGREVQELTNLPWPPKEAVALHPRRYSRRESSWL